MLFITPDWAATETRLPIFKWPASPTWAPTDGASSQPVARTLSWHTAEGNDVVYDLYMDQTASPTTLVEDNIEDTFYAYSGLQNSKTYYWKIVARNANGSTTSDSIFSFGTVAPS